MRLHTSNAKTILLPQRQIPEDGEMADEEEEWADSAEDGGDISDDGDETNQLLACIRGRY